MKPSVGAGSNGVIRSFGDSSVTTSHVETLHSSGLTAMIQRYEASIDEVGETGLVYLAGTFSHAFKKEAILAKPIEWEGGLYAEEAIGARLPTPEERALGDAVMARLPPTAYARIDMLPTDDGPALLEVEVTEPSLFFEVDPASAARAAAAFRSLVA